MPAAQPAGGEVPSIRVPEPQTFAGARELENFLFDMEQYFLASRTDNRDKVSGGFHGGRRQAVVAHQV